MQRRGFPLTRDDLRRIAYEYAAQIGIKHRFNNETKKAGYDWLNAFLRRNPDISVRKSEGVSIARSQAMNRQEVEAYFELLRTTLEEHNLFDKPGHIYNMDESGLQLNSRPGHVLAAKGSKAVSTVTSTERGETITVIGCCNAEGTVLPPACIMKGKNKKPEFTDNMAPGSILYMSQKSAYINSTIFLEWLRDHFLPRKPAGKVLLILDGHGSHSTSIEMLNFCDSNDIILLCLPSHTTHYLQPLDRAVFKSLKGNFYNACRLWLKNHPGRRITRQQFGQLLQESWGKSASNENAVSGFRACGIFPFNPQAIPDFAFAIADNGELPVPVDDAVPEKTKQPNSKNLRDPLPDKPERTELREEKDEPQPSTSKEIRHVPEESPMTKLLHGISPVPVLVQSAKKRAKQVASLLTSPENRKECLQKSLKKKPTKEKMMVKTPKSQKRKTMRDSSSSDEAEVVFAESSDSAGEEFNENECVGCGNMFET
ncbi:hypothetical protein PPYR_01463 [Photinus pyralis]|uniref:HTH CENPB-type domain-containing protein n=1 Tax=Photinus pyralis TaxID=7054 RepID=A0A5N4B4L8_PHOPY|nr:hypothetical protein PPYR_01463 [Photinus pyralis]